MDAFTGLVSSLLAIAWQAFSLFIELIVSILSFFLVLFQSIIGASRNLIPNATL